MIRKRLPRLSSTQEVEEIYRYAVENLHHIHQNEQSRDAKHTALLCKRLHTLLLFKLDSFEKLNVRISSADGRMLQQVRNILNENVKHLIKLDMIVNKKDLEKRSSLGLSSVSTGSNSNPSFHPLNTPGNGLHLSMHHGTRPSPSSSGLRPSPSSSVLRPMLKSLRSNSHLSNRNGNDYSNSYSKALGAANLAMHSMDSSIQTRPNGFERTQVTPEVCLDPFKNFPSELSLDNWNTTGNSSQERSLEVPCLIDLDDTNDFRNDYYIKPNLASNTLNLEKFELLSIKPIPPSPRSQSIVYDTTTKPRLNTVLSSSSLTLPRLKPTQKMQPRFIYLQPIVKPTYVYKKPIPLNVTKLMKTVSKPKTTPNSARSASITTVANDFTSARPSINRTLFNSVVPSKTMPSASTRIPNASTKMPNSILVNPNTKPVAKSTPSMKYNYARAASKPPAADRQPTGNLKTRPEPSASPGKDGTKNQSSSVSKEDEVIISLIRGIDPHAAEQILNDIVVKGDPVQWDDVVGLDIAKNGLKEAVVYPFLRPDLFQGLREPARGMLLFGPPGTGKTMLARAVATELRSTFFSISLSSLTSKYLGESEKLVKALFLLARKMSPLIVFIDEIDSLLCARSEGEQESTRRIKNEFLVQWSELLSAAAGRDNAGEDILRVLILGATNLPWSIDEAARRRFVRRQYIPLPEAETRKAQILRLLQFQNHTLSDQDLKELTVLTEGFSGSDITALAKDSAMGPLRLLGDLLLSTATENIRAINLQDFKNSLVYIRPSVSQEGIATYEAWAEKFGSSGA